MLLEAGLLALAGVGLAFAANALSPRGLNLTRDNFPRQPVVPSLWPAGHEAGAGVQTNAASAHAALAERLRAEGLRLMDGAEALQLFNDPRYAQELVVFIDARDDAAYQAGHIPGAYQFNRYYPEKYVSTMLQVCGAAQQVVVYCNGGDCDDSEFAARMLSEWGVPKSKLAVYGGGITEWTHLRRPIETGQRHSGILRPY